MTGCYEALRSELHGLHSYGLPQFRFECFKRLSLYILATFIGSILLDMETFLCRNIACKPFIFVCLVFNQSSLLQADLYGPSILAEGILEIEAD